MAVTNFIPELWSARLLHALDKSHVAANLVNRDYEGMITQQGDTVHINSIGAVTVKDYTKNSDIEAPEELTTADQTLVIRASILTSRSMTLTRRRQQATLWIPLCSARRMH